MCIRDRAKMVGEGAPLLLPIAYDQPLDDASDRMNTVREMVAEYQATKAAMSATPAAIRSGVGLAQRPVQIRTRGRGSMRYRRARRQ